MREQQFHQFRTQTGFATRKLQEWFRAKPQTQRRLISGGLGLMVVALLTLVAAMPMITSASEMDALGNGGFERGFTAQQGCGDVGTQWNCFTNGGAANYGFYNDQWDATVYEGESSQLIEINTKGMTAGDNDRYAGISQTTRVVPGAPYTFSLRGMIRTTNLEGDAWRYVVQVGWVGQPQGNWKDVTNWVELPWNTYYNRTEPGAFSAFQTQLVPNSEVITVFVRVWKKWGVPYEEIDVNLDAISLTGPAVNRPHEGGKHDQERPDGIGGPVPGQEYRPEQFQPQGPQQGQQQGPQQQGPQQQGPQQQGQQQQGPQAPENRPQEYPPTYRPHEEREEYPVSCGGENLIYNGSFEGGFNEVPWGVAGKGWEAFTNGGAANYGFYDEQWDIVVADGNHGQLIEINSKAVFPTDPDRYAGISQRISGLRYGETYEFALRGGLRGVGNEDDPYRFAAQWGLGTPEGWQSVEEWTTMDLGPIGVRTQPLPLAQYKVQFEAETQGAVLYIRGWKKWGITNVEMDFNLDAISLRSCEPRGHEKLQGGGQQPQHPGTGGPCNNPCGNSHSEYDEYEHDEHQGGNHHQENYCTVVVEPGDTLSQIAVDHGVSLEAMIHANDIYDASTIYVGQELVIPGCDEGKAAYGPVNQVSNPEAQPTQQWEIVQGQGPEETLSLSGPSIRPSFEEPVSGAPTQASEITYTVQDGDMLSYIAEAYSVSAYALASYNGIDNTDFIYTGQVLAIPN